MAILNPVGAGATATGAEGAAITGAEAAATLGAGPGATGLAMLGIDGMEGVGGIDGMDGILGTAGAAGAAGATAAAGVMTGAGAAVTIAARAAAICCLMMAFASSVDSAPQVGQLIGTGMRSLTGSTSNSNRVPQGHWTLTFIPMAWGSAKQHPVH